MPTSLAYTELSEKAGISPSYANEIVNKARVPSRSLAIHILRTTGWRHEIIADLSESQIELLETIEPWQKKSGRAA